MYDVPCVRPVIVLDVEAPEAVWGPTSGGVVVMVYPATLNMAEPFAFGATHVTVIAVPALPERAVVGWAGASGYVAGVTSVLYDVGGLSPMLFVAVTLNVYAVPHVS